MDTSDDSRDHAECLQQFFCSRGSYQNKTQCSQQEIMKREKNTGFKETKRDHRLETEVGNEIFVRNTMQKKI